jgi:tol-pal system protein YbgF
MKHILIAFVVLAGLTPAPAAFAQSRADRQMMADIRMLQEQAQQLALTLATLNDALKAINSRLDKSDESTRKAIADQRLVVENMGSDLRVIRERTDETNVRINTLSQEMDALRTSITQIQCAPTATAPVDPTAPDAGLPAGAPPATPAAPSSVGLSPTRMYETAFADYAAGQWSLAISGFEAFLKTFPKSEMADEAQYYIGETHYASGKYQDAVAAFNRVIQNYPTSNSTPQAYYKRGAAQERLKDLDAARESWEFVIKQYPDSDAARLAKQNLDRIGPAKKPEAQL